MRDRPEDSMNHEAAPGQLADDGLVILAEGKRQAQRSNAIGLNPVWR